MEVEPVSNPPSSATSVSLAAALDPGPGVVGIVVVPSAASGNATLGPQATNATPSAIPIPTFAEPTVGKSRPQNGHAVSSARA